MNPRRLKLLKALAAAGAALSAWLTVRHLRFVASGGEAAGVCSLAGVFDCRAVEASRFSEFFGIPTAALGAHYFLWLGALAWGAGRAGEGAGEIERARGRLALWGIAGLAACAALASISLFIIRAVCLECAAVYLIVLAACGAIADRGAGKFFSDAAAGLGAGLPRGGAARAAVAALTFGLYAAAWGGGKWAAGEAERRAPAAPTAGAEAAAAHAKLLADWRAAPEVAFAIGERALAKGPADAPVEVVIFSDYECPHCRKFNEAMAPILAGYERRVRIVKKHFPLSPDCNPLVRGTKFNHKRACRLAEMAQALAALGKYWEAEGDLYAIGERDLNPALNEIAAKMGLAYRDWVAELADPAIRRQVEADIREGIALGVMEIPKIYVNKRVAPTAKPADVEAVMAEAERRILNH